MGADGGGICSTTPAVGRSTLALSRAPLFVYRIFKGLCIAGMIEMMILLVWAGCCAYCVGGRRRGGEEGGRKGKGWGKCYCSIDVRRGSWVN